MAAINTQQLLELAISQDYKRWPVVTMNNEFVEYHEYVKYVLDQLELQLLHNKYVVVGIDNGNNTNESTLRHDFILYRNGANSIIKLEHYMPFYQSCIGNGENWRSNLMTLLNSTTDSDRLRLWNDIFSARERYDNNNSLRIKLHINPTTIRRPILSNVIHTMRLECLESLDQPDYINHRRMLVGNIGNSMRGTTL